MLKYKKLGYYTLKGENMKKRYIFLSILLLIIIALGITVYLNFDNIVAIYEATQYTTEEIEQKIAENEKKAAEVLDKYTKTEIKPLSEEDAKKMADGELTEEEAVNLILGKTEPEQSSPTEEQQPTQSTVENNQQTTEEVVEEENDEVEEKIGELVAKIYILKARYNDMIEKENYNVASDFYSLPKEEQTKERKYQMGLTFMNNLISLQKRCDGEMEVILSELAELLKNNDMSTELVDEIRKSYEEEKKSKKAYFVNKYTAKESRVNDEV